MNSTIEHRRIKANEIYRDTVMGHEAEHIVDILERLSAANSNNPDVDVRVAATLARKIINKAKAARAEYIADCDESDAADVLEDVMGPEAFAAGVGSCAADINHHTGHGEIFEGEIIEPDAAPVSTAADDRIDPIVIQRLDWHEAKGHHDYVN